MTWFMMNDMHLLSRGRIKKINFSYDIPRTKEDLVKRRKATQLWANETLGVLGRSPDYVNTMIAIMAGAKKFFC